MIGAKIFLTIAILSALVAFLVYLLEDREKSLESPKESNLKMFPIVGGLSVILCLFSFVLALICFIWGI